MKRQMNIKIILISVIIVITLISSFNFAIQPARCYGDEVCYLGRWRFENCLTLSCGGDHNNPFLTCPICDPIY